VHNRKLRGDRLKSSNVEKPPLARPKMTRGGGQKLFQKAQQEQRGGGELRGKLVRAWVVQALEPPMLVSVGKEAEEQQEEVQIQQEGAVVLVGVCVEGVEA
jgi:hypothetical protein